MMSYRRILLFAVLAHLALSLGAADFHDLKGVPQSLEQFRGKVVVLNFWATWCLPCQQEVPALVQLDEQYRERGLNVIGISVDRQGTPQQVQRQLRRFVEKYGIQYPVYVDGDLEVVKKFGSFTAIPRTFVLDRQGKVIHTLDGVVGHDELSEVVEPLLRRAPEGRPSQKAGGHVQEI